MIKQTIKNLLGPTNAHNIKKLYRTLVYFCDKARKYNGQIESNYNFIILESNEKHLFFGYYDIKQENEGLLLYHAIPIDAKIGIDAAEIGFIELKNKQMHCITQSMTWCWQQGSRLRWNTQNCKEILFNNFFDGNYCTEKWDIYRKTLVERYPHAFYDISHNMKYGLSLNFSRLQRLRPGYGYCNTIDYTESEKAPKNEGIWYYDMDADRCELIIDLYDISQKMSSDCDFHNYFNHISISPDDKHFIFFHIMTKGVGESWKTNLFCSDLRGNYRLLEGVETVSHYCWISNEEIIITTVLGNYYIYNINTGEKRLLTNESLTHDGHPSSISQSTWIVSDTYPLAENKQQLFYADANSNEQHSIAKIYSDPRLFGEYRCDLHPRLSRENTLLCVDSTLKHGKRVMIVFNLEEGKDRFGDIIKYNNPCV